MADLVVFLWGKPRAVTPGHEAESPWGCSSGLKASSLVPTVSLCSSLPHDPGQVTWS